MAPPTTHQTIHPSIGEGVSTDFKSSNRIKISRFVHVLLNFYWFGWSPSPRWGVKWGFGDDVGMTGMMWGWQGWHGDDGDDMGTTGMMWGLQGCGDHEITKIAITREQIEIIQFHLKLWDPWTLLHTYRLDLICRWECPFEIIAEMKIKCKIWLKHHFELQNGFCLVKLQHWPVAKHCVFPVATPIMHLIVSPLSVCFPSDKHAFES